MKTAYLFGIICIFLTLAKVSGAGPEQDRDGRDIAEIHESAKPSKIKVPAEAPNIDEEKTDDFYLKHERIVRSLDR